MCRYNVRTTDSEDLSHGKEWKAIYGRKILPIARGRVATAAAAAAATNQTILIHLTHLEEAVQRPPTPASHPNPIASLRR